MTRQVDDATWRNRFITLHLTRIGGTLVVMIGLFVWFRNGEADHSMMIVGLPLALIGLVISFWGPQYLSRKWRREDKG
jgi:formate-dependent nitrite reductase membrane component NrfD